MNTRLRKIESTTRKRHKSKDAIRVFVVWDAEKRACVDGVDIPWTEYEREMAEEGGITLPDNGRGDTVIHVRYQDDLPTSTITAGTYTARVGIDASKI